MIQLYEITFLRATRELRDYVPLHCTRRGLIAQAHTQTDRQFSEVSSFRKKSYKSLSGEGERDTRTTHTVRQGRDMTEREGGHCCRVIQYSGYSVDFSSLGSKKTSVDYEEDDAAMPAILPTIMQLESVRCTSW